ncbi:catechol 2,3-dioxygenase [Microbacterium endophyticum]|uniref:Catechol 2,3-dioxygenase n=1 Tax=Microbacterium endophyticum TaxID=1526412 RepID=A0A7W4YMK5_9MICO|nr:VOC family protein [Microbacterium endophyticum]MBB2975217.1 catechol 2,3-dioxygenase [Microbacterium endophyticum]NIK37571.1 catechol 2,3-dioxygenase [Microbacterium endophyticum]
MNALQSPSPADKRFINPDTTMDAVSLRVGDLDLMSTYYQNALALTPIEERSRGTEVHRVLGRGEVPMVRFIHTPGLPGVDQHEAGLYHTAFLFDDAPSLAATVYRAAQDARTQFTGSSDHLVSEAFYFTDPEGNGIELYTDRPREKWEYRDGQIAMDTVYLDPNEYLRRHLTQEVFDVAPALAGRVGHVHLQVGDVPTARSFYVDAIGFEPTFSGFPTALFASAGGYHHHVAMNTWNSRGAGPRAVRLGLGDVSVTVPDRADLDALASRLRRQGVQFGDDGRAIVTHDPWGTQVTVMIAGMTADELLSR